MIVNLPYPFRSWAEYLRLGAYAKPANTQLNALYEQKYYDKKALLYRELRPGCSDTKLVSYQLHWAVRQKSPHYGNFSFRICDFLTGRRALVRFSLFEEFELDPITGSCKTATVYPFEANRQRIDQVMNEASSRFYRELFAIGSEWSKHRPQLIISHHDYRQRYHQYLQSSEWKKKADVVRQKYCNTCQECGKRSSASRALDVHHKTYQRIGEEPLEDLVALCRACHDALHRGQLSDPSDSRQPRDWRAAA